MPLDCDQIVVPFTVIETVRTHETQVTDIILTDERVHEGWGHFNSSNSDCKYGKRLCRVTPKNLLSYRPVVEEQLE